MEQFSRPSCRHFCHGVKAVVILCTNCILLVTAATCQLRPEVRVGAVTGISTLHADALPCCPLSSTSMMTSVVLGTGLSLELTEILSLSMHLDVRTGWRSATAFEHTTILQPQTHPPSAIPARFEHTVDVTMFSPGIEMGCALALHNIVLRTGLSSRFYTIPTAELRTSLTSSNPNAVVLNGFDGERVWNRPVVDGHVLSAWSDVIVALPTIGNGHQFNISGGVEIPVVDGRRYLITHGLHMRIGVVYQWPLLRAELPEADVDEPPTELHTPYVPDFADNLPDVSQRPVIRLVALQGRHPDTLFVETEETETNDHLPVLPGIFFDEGASELPRRFRNAIAAWQTHDGDVDVATAARAGLAIVAKRLQQNSGFTLRLIGTTSSYGADTGHRLARQRAESVRDELIRLGVNPQQLIVETAPTPRHPTIAADPADAPSAREENQRVELVGHDDLFEPVLVRRITNDSAHGALAAILEHHDTTTTHLSLVADTVTIVPRADVTGMTKNIRFPVDLFHSLPEGIHTIVGITWEGGLRGTRDSLTVIRRHRQRRRRDLSGGHVVDRVRLIVFSYDETIIRGANLMRIKSLRSAISPADSIQIIGRTDKIGAASYNMEVSRRRALETARALATPRAVIIASGEGQDADYKGADVYGRNDVHPTTGRFSDATPEGRMYNRTVIIERIFR